MATRRTRCKSRCGNEALVGGTERGGRVESLCAAAGNGSTGIAACEGAPGGAEARDRTWSGPGRYLQPCVRGWQAACVCAQEGRGRGREEHDWELLTT